jgi:hypothetical protein
MKYLKASQNKLINESQVKKSNQFKETLEIDLNKYFPYQ